MEIDEIDRVDVWVIQSSYAGRVPPLGHRASSGAPEQSRDGDGQAEAATVRTKRAKEAAAAARKGAAGAATWNGRHAS